MKKEAEMSESRAAGETIRPLRGEPMTAEQILQNVREIGPQFRDRAAEIDRIRRIPDDLVALLRKSGAFRILMPRSWGGPEFNPVQSLELLEELARWDASASWCVMIGSDSGLFGAFLEDSAGRELHPDLDMTTANVLAPTAKAEIVDGGYVVNGRWQFGSSIPFADLITGGAVVFKDGKPVLDKGRPKTIIVFGRPDQYQIMDNWDTIGLRGTGSNDYLAKDMFVKTEHAFSLADKPHQPGAIYSWKPMFLVKVPGVPLGIAKNAIETVRDIMKDKVDGQSGQKLADSERIQLALAEAQMIYRGARAYLFDTVTRVWEKVENGDLPDVRDREDLIMSRINAFQGSRKAIGLMYDTLGSSAVYKTGPLERAVRDIHTACVHWSGQMKTLHFAGKLMLHGRLKEQMVL